MVGDGIYVGLSVVGTGKDTRLAYKAYTVALYSSASTRRTDNRLFKDFLF